MTSETRKTFAPDRLKHRLPLATLLILTAIFSLLRFVHLQADFPSSAWEPLFALTDEGWYTRGAAEAVLHNHWYVDGDFNPAVDVPFLSIVDSALFRTFGVSVVTARAANVFFSICSIWLVFFIVRDFESDEFAAVCAFILSVSKFWFAYSRVALLEFPMTALLLLGAFISLRRGNNYLIGLFTGSILICAVLTKWTALAIVPAIWLLAFMKFDWSNSAIKRVMVSATVLAFGILAYREFVLLHYETDHAYFEFINITERVHSFPLYLSLHWSLHDVQHLGTELALVAFGMAILYFFCNRSYLLKPLFLFAGFWFLLFIAALTYAHYQPTRYYQPLLVPVVVMFVYGLRTTWQYSWQYPQYPKLKILTFLLLALVTVSDAGVDLQLIARPSFSVIGMHRDVGRILNQSEKPVLLGHISNSVALETHVPSVNSHFAPGLLEDRIRRFKPTHYIAIDRTEKTERAVLLRSFHLEEIAHYKVEDSPKIRLFKMVPITEISRQNSQGGSR